MLNLKLQTIASLINKDDIVIDTCCDHAYLAIYLKENNLCKEVYASDISDKALLNAQNNIKKHNLQIETFLSDGFKNIKLENINTVVIAGVGTNTVLDIVNSAPKDISKYIISSNNDFYNLRKKMKKQAFYIKKEIIVKENNKYYPIILFTKDYRYYNKNVLKFGDSNNKMYYEYLLQKEQNILAKIPKKHLLTRLTHIRNIKYLKKILIKRIQDC